MQDLLRITASWLQTNSDTGRVSVENPNMQCVPKPRTFTVPTTQLDGSRIFEANLRYALLDSFFSCQQGYAAMLQPYCTASRSWCCNYQAALLSALFQGLAFETNTLTSGTQGRLRLLSVFANHTSSVFC